MQSIERKYYQDIQYKPFLFYVIFGVSADELQVSQSKHHVDEFPKKLEIHSLNRTEHKEYIEGFFSGQLGKVLQEENAELFDQCKQAENCVILRGEIENDSTFDYMKNIIGIIQAFTESEAIGILDLFTFSLISSQDWTERFFEKDINAQDHAVIFVSEEKGYSWLHTRGMGKFGRPDLSLIESDKELVQEDKALLDQMIFYSGEGAFFKDEVILETSENKYKVLCEFVPDWNNNDFNNAHINIKKIERMEH